MSIDKRGKNVFRFRIMHNKNNYTMTFYGSEREAKAAHEEFKLKVKRGEFLDQNTMTVNELWDFYLESRQLEAGSLRCHKQYRNSFDFLDMQVSELTKAFLKNYHNKHQKRRDDTDYAALRTVLNFAVEMDIISVNPLSFKLRKTSKKKFEQIFTLDELKRFLNEVLLLENKRMKAFLLIQLVLGTRYGETAGIVRESVDTTNHILSIRQQFKEVPDGLGIGKTKTSYSERDLFILEFLRPYLYEVVLSTPPGSLLFQTKGKYPFLNSRINGDLAAICERAGVPVISSHKLRKLAATIAIYAGVDPLTVSKSLGHASLNMTEHYLLTMNDVAREKMEKINAVLSDLS